MPPVFMKMVTRPVEEDWHCKRSGDCCRSVDFVVMTDEEKAALMEFAEKEFTIKKLNTLRWEPNPVAGMVGLVAGPCPLLEMVDGKPTCTVHPVRPYNCRRFGCLRPDPKKEPLQMAPLSPYLRYGNVGCVNLRERLLQSRVARRTYELLQRKGQRWADKHGWLRYLQR